MLDTAHKARAIAEAYTKEWNAKSPDGVASFFTADARLTVNHGESHVGHEPIAAMAAEIYALIPDIVVRLDDFRQAGNDLLFAWTWQGTHSVTGARCTVSGWDHWTLNKDLQITNSTSLFDTENLIRQMATGAAQPH